MVLDENFFVGGYAHWLSECAAPKLFIKGEPGMTLRDDDPVEFCRSWPDQAEVAVPGLHFLQEDSPDEIGRAVARWLTTIADPACG
jgi:haloalkane dehalogenase